MILDVLSGFAVFLLLCISAGVGRYIQPRLRDGHRNRETVEAMQITIGMLVTLTALVLGLLTASVKGAYDKAGNDLQAYALDLTSWISACATTAWGQRRHGNLSRATRRR